MPNINSIPEVLYEPNQPYHYHYDNLPLKNILTRIGLVNVQTDINADMIRGASGTRESIAARLDASLDSSGSLKAESVDSAVHGIGHHADGEGPDGESYVRMKASERAKLALVASESNRLVIEVQDSFPTVGESVSIFEGSVRLEGSSTILLDFESPNTIRFHLNLPPDSIHRHHYGVEPVDASLEPSSPDRINFKTTSLNTPYKEGSLRVYLNGSRLCDQPLPVPNSSGTGFDLTYIESEEHCCGRFSINRAISMSDVIRIDFEEVFESLCPEDVEC